MARITPDIDPGELSIAFKAAIETPDLTALGAVKLTMCPEVVAVQSSPRGTAQEITIGLDRSVLRRWLCDGGHSSDLSRGLFLSRRESEKDKLKRPESLVADLTGTTCFACRKTKVSAHSFCKPYYRRLPNTMQQGLYKRFGHGYEQAFADALDWLNINDKRTQSLF